LFRRLRLLHERRSTQALGVSMAVVLREFQESDVRRLKEWAKHIHSESYMSRYLPIGSTARGHNPERGLFWFVIQSARSDVGTVWLERGRQPDEGVLGILLGHESFFGRGIGKKAIDMAIETARGCAEVRSASVERFPRLMRLLTSAHPAIVYFSASPETYRRLPPEPRGGILQAPWPNHALQPTPWNALAFASLRGRRG
jgi:RimJ/RimL family protein N-acetyltransferase